jgi:hypothetical protein
MPVNVSDCINRSEFIKKKTKERKDRVGLFEFVAT